MQIKNIKNVQKRSKVQNSNVNLKSLKLKDTFKQHTTDAKRYLALVTTASK